MTSLSPAPWIRLAETLGHTLLHSLWQGLAVALALGFCLSVIEKRRAKTRCLVAYLAMLILPIWMAVTISADWHEPVHGSSSSPASAGQLTTGPENSLAAHRIESGSQGSFKHLNWHTVIASGWAIGAAIFLLRLASGWWGLRQLRNSSVPIIDVNIRRRYARVCDRLAIRQRVALLSCEQISTPLMCGFLWPAIILPAGILNGVPAAHLQSILAHELAHFRRWDYVANICQSVIEALLFYHPAMWWISRQIRIERENACDDLATAIPGNGFRRYAGALAWLEENRSQQAIPGPAMAMSGGRNDTLSRIERLRSIFAGWENPAQQGGMTGSTGLLWVLGAAFGVTIVSASPTNPNNSLPPTANRSTSENQPITVFHQCHMGAQRAGRSSRLLNQRVIWQQRYCNDVEVPLFRSVVILEKGGKLYNLHKKKPRLFPEFPNQYLLDNELNLLDGQLPQRDPDGDGFTVLEEFQANTDPCESESHPDYAGKLRFISRHKQVYRITFAARPDASRFQLNRRPSVTWNRKTMILRIGEITADGQLRLDKLTEEGLEVTHLASGTVYRLPKGEQVEIPTWFAELQLNLTGEIPFYVELGENFRLSREPGRVLRLDGVEEREAKVIDPQTADSWDIGSPVKSPD